MKPSSRWTPLLLVGPALSIFCLVVLLPLLGTIGLSVTRWNGFGTPSFAGFDNYQRAITDSVFIKSFSNVGVYIAATLILEVLVGLILAGALSSRKSTTIYRVALFVPVMLPMVVVSVLWRFIYNPDFGLINAIVRKLGGENFSQVWLGDTRTALLSICFVSGWVYSGFYLAIFTAGLQRIPRDIIESAALDGASERILFWRIKVPMIKSVNQVSALLCITGGIQGFDLFYVMTGGGPYYTTEVPTTYMVRSVFRDQEIGYGSALAIVVTLIVLVVGFIFTKIRKQNENSLEY
jgi:raffinose/stachyose/melibiose transport system permease protein